MKACLEHTLAISPKLKEADSWITTFRRKHGFYPLPCLKCGYLDLDPETYEKKRLLELKGSLKDRSKYLVKSYDT